VTLTVDEPGSTTVSQTLVCDASAIVAVLLDNGVGGQWATRTLVGANLAAPALLGFEVDNIIRRHERAGLISADQAAQAHADLLALPVEFWPHAVLAGRSWQLRANLTAYDAAYVALAELLDSPLVTLDARLAVAPGRRCEVLVP
jgi:predicted nucleic acid-binding protein